MTEKQPQKQHSELRDERNMPKTMPHSFIQTVNNLSAQQGPEGLQAPYLLVIPMNHFSFPNMSFPSFTHQQQQSSENSQFPLIQVAFSCTIVALNYYLKCKNIVDRLPKCLLKSLSRLDLKSV